ncbi:hypothetical protein MRB53_007125 [Persea americana]|uniref:Uncharacterized protein n=1 Tax=Persea americana TaxID=3435 RepID=A0ACC2MJQ9_PERAE|nr:hypothetical protein MRB53_007125 [Persea americana]
MHPRVGQLPAIAVSSKGFAKEFMKTHGLNFADRPQILSSKIIGCGAMVSFSSYGDYWRQLSKIYKLELLSAKRGESFTRIRGEEVCNLAKSVLAAAGSPINLREKFLSLTNKVVTRATLLAIATPFNQDNFDFKWGMKWESEEVHMGGQVERFGTHEDGHRMCPRYSEVRPLFGWESRYSETPLFLLIFTFSVFIFMLLKKTQNSVPKLPPGPRTLPVLGNLHQLFGSLPHRSLRDLANEHGALMHLRLGQLSTIVVSSAGFAKEFMKTHDLNFVDRPQILAAKVVGYGSTVSFSSYGDYWRQLRKIYMLELFSAKRVESFKRIREEEVFNLVKFVSAAAGSPINLSEKFLSLTNRVVTRACFGKECKDQDVFIEALKELVTLASGFDVGDVFPSLEFVQVISGLKFRLERVHRKMDRVLDDILQEREENMSKETNEGRLEEDLVDVLLRLQRDGDLEIPITKRSIKAVLAEMFIAGTETASTVMEWAMAELMRNPKVMEKAQAEVREVLKGKAPIEEKDTHELNYLKLVIKETLRLHTPLPLLLPRECRERCEIDGYEIPAKTRVIINAWAIGRDPQQWDDAESFRPERFIGTSIDFKGADFELIPFGAGRRMCPGMSFGVATVELALAQLLYYFEWKLPNAIEPEDLDMTEAFGVAMGRKSNLYLIPFSHLPS